MNTSKTFLLLLLTSFSLTIIAQNDSDTTSHQYKYFAGGGIGYSSQTVEDIDSDETLLEFKNFEFTPRIGYILSDKSEIGITMLFEKYTGTNQYSRNTLGGS